MWKRDAKIHYFPHQKITLKCTEPRRGSVFEFSFSALLGTIKRVVQTGGRSGLGNFTLKRELSYCAASNVSLHSQSLYILQRFVLDLSSAVQRGRCQLSFIEQNSYIACACSARHKSASYPLCTGVSQVFLICARVFRLLSSHNQFVFVRTYYLQYYITKPLYMSVFIWTWSG